jgi:hypothetical protein
VLGVVVCQGLEQTQLERLNVWMIMLFSYRYHLCLSHCFDEGFKGKRSLGGKLDQCALQLGPMCGGQDQTIRW